MIINRRTILGGLTATGLMPVMAHARTRPSVADYARLPPHENVNLSPDGKKIAYTSRHGTDQVVVVHDLGTDTRHRTAVDKAKLRTVKWIGNDHLLLLTEIRYHHHALGRGMNDYMLGIILDPYSGKVTQLLSGNPREDVLNSGRNPTPIRLRVNFPFVSPPFHSFTHDGKPYITGTAVSDRYLFSAFTPDSADYFVMDATHYNAQWLIDTDGTLLMRAEYSDVDKAWILSRYAPNKKKGFDHPTFYAEGYWTEILRQKTNIDVPYIEGMGRNGDSAVIWLDNQLHEISLSGDLTPLRPVSGYNVELEFHPQTRRLAGYTHKPLWPEYVYFDPELAALQQKIKDIFGAYRVMVVSRADDPSKLLLYGEAIDDSGTYYLADLRSGDIEEYARPYGHINDDKVCPQEVITYQASDGLSIEAIVTYPVGVAPRQLPFIVLPHGGPQAHDSLQFDYMAQCFAAHGYGVLQPNYRGSTGYGLDFVNAGHGEWGRRMQTDLSDGVTYLTSEGIADAARVSIVGASYGGYAALAGVALQQGIYNCAVSISGVSDLHRINDWEIRESRSRKARRVLYWQRFMGDRQYWDERSPYRQAHRIEVPVLLIHGEDDEVVPIDQSLMMAAALKQNKKEHTFLRLKGEDHYMTFGHTRLEMLTATLRFLQKHNPVTVA